MRAAEPPFGDDDFGVGPPLDEPMVRRAEEALGVRLPRGYLALLHTRNGGVLRRRRFPTPFATSWAPDHVEADQLLGIGGSDGIDTALGSAYLVREWEYPAVGVVAFLTPSCGHDAVMFDYSACGPAGELSIAYVDEDRVPRTVAGGFDEFIAGLLPSC